MKREEILQRSQLENKNGDEREIKQRILATRNGYLVTTFLVGFFMVLAYLNIIQGEFILFTFSMPIGVFLALIFLIGTSAELISRYLYFKKPSYLIWLVLVFILCVCVIVGFFLRIR